MRNSNVSRAPSDVKSAQFVAWFWNNVQTNEHGCWEWQGARKRNYGRLKYDGKDEGAHRVAYMLTYGPIVEGLEVRHKCDNPPCINPAHLLVGTRADNMADKAARGRSGRGLASWHSLFSPREVDEIRLKHSAGASVDELVEEYNAAPENIRNIVIGLLPNGRAA